MAQACDDNGVEVWSYRLMPNQVHLAEFPSSRDGLSRAVGKATAGALVADGMISWWRSLRFSSAAAIARGFWTKRKMQS